jgi:hypothetical protein
MKRGFLLSLDALVAISLLVMISMFLVGLSYTYSSPDLRYQRYYYAGKDVVNLFEQTRMDSVSFLPVVQDYLARGVLDEEDMNRTILDVVGSFWAAGNQSYAENLTSGIVNAILSNTAYGFEILMNGESIYQNGSLDPDYVTRLTTIVSGYEKDKPVNGYVAKVYMTKVRKTGMDFSYFGGYVGDGNVTRLITLPGDANVTSVYLEMNVGNNFTLYINGQDAGSYVKTVGNFSADKWTVCSETVNPSYCSYFGGGNNSVHVNFTGSGIDYIGGGYLKTAYRTSDLTGTDYIYTGNTTVGKYWFPGIKGLINLYSSFYVPGTLRNISVRLHYLNNLTMNNVSIPLYFLIGSEEMLRTNETGERDVYIPDEYISGIFGGKPNLTKILSNATIPIRFGTETFEFIEGIGRSDSVLITDRSGSMITCDVQSECMPGICDVSPPCYRRRINVAKEVGEEFVDTMLSYKGNRVGLTAYGDSVCSYHNLTNDSVSLNSRIDTYGSDCGYTCISCGINKAGEILKTQRAEKTIIAEKGNWLYNATYPFGDPPDDANGTSWTEINYTDSGWDEGQAMLGFENAPYSPDIDTDIGDNGGNYHFRKQFNMSDLDVESAGLYVLSDDRAEVYLNGYLIDNDTQEHNATYWNRPGVDFSDGFEDGDINGWVTGGDADWYADNSESHNGSWSAASGNIGDDETTWIRRDVNGPAEITFWWKVDSRNNRDWLYYYVDGYVQDGISGNEDWQQKSDFIPSGTHTVEWRYTKNSGGRGADKGWIDDVVVVKKIDVDTSYFVKGKNVIAVRLHNDDNGSAKFDLKLKITESRYKAMLVMSDGSANRCIPGWDCGDENAKQEAVDKACEAREVYNFKVYAVAFGGGADQTTLRRIACWNCSANDWIPGCDKFYNSSNAEELKDIYREIAEDIANATYEAQIFNVTGNISLENILYPDSYISFNYTPIVRTLEYGEITMKFESPRLRDSTGETLITDNTTGTKEGWFTIPSNTEVVTKVLDSKITSYSSYYWTDRLWVNSSNTPGQNWTGVYWLGNYSDEYELLGDPYVIQIPPNLLRPGGNNSFKIGTGIYPSPVKDGLGGSPDDRVIYAVGVTGVGLTEYSDVFPKAKGSRVTIYYDTNGDNIPDKYVIVEVGPNPDDIFDPENDSIDNGFMKLIDTLNFISDLNPNVVDFTHNATGPTGSGDGSPGNPIDLEITEEVKFHSDFISHIYSLWGPATMEVRVWS